MNNKQIILKLLRPGKQKARMYGSWLALCIGMLLLFVAVIAWFDFREILNGNGGNDSMSEYLVIGKKIGDENAGVNIKANLFDTMEVQQLSTTSGVQEVGALTSNRFPVSASMGGSLGFYTELFLESVDNRFLDVKPDEWHWEPGEPALPIIMSNEFLKLYNYGFALSQGYPQLSQTTIKSLPFVITIAGKEKYQAKIVGFTDRISSVLVPQNFMDEMNKQYGNQSVGKPSRLILKVKDPSDKEFVQYLEDKKYTVNQDQLRWSRIRTTVQAIVSSVGGVALIVVGMAILAFILFVEITVQRAASHIKLMMQIGYAPTVLSKILNRFFLPWISSAVIVALAIAIALHYVLLQWLKSLELHLSLSTAWPVIGAALLMLILMALLLTRSVSKMLKNV